MAVNEVKISREALVKSCNACLVWSSVPGHLYIPNIHQNNKLQISLGKVELFCLFVACSYTSRKASVLSCRFSWVLSGMPKVL